MYYVGEKLNDDKKINDTKRKLFVWFI